MKAAIKRAEARAERAYYLINDTVINAIEPAAVCAAIHQIESELATLKELVRCEPTGESV